MIWNGPGVIMDEKGKAYGKGDTLPSKGIHDKTIIWAKKQGFIEEEKAPEPEEEKVPEPEKPEVEKPKKEAKKKEAKKEKPVI